MKKLVHVAALAAAVAMSSLAFSGAAFAAPPKTHHAKTEATATKPAAKEETTTGVVSSYAADTRLLTLNAGGKFTLGPSVTSTSYKAGDKVKVGWKMEKGARIADTVTMAN